MKHGFTKVPHSILRDPSLSCVDKCLWAVIASHSEGYPLSLPELCHMLGVSHNTCVKALSRLEQRGLLVVTKYIGEKSRYQIIDTPSKNERVTPSKSERVPLQKLNHSPSKIERVPLQNLNPTPSKIEPPTPYYIEKNNIEEQLKEHLEEQRERDARRAHARGKNKNNLEDIVEELFAVFPRL